LTSVTNQKPPKKKKTKLDLSTVKVPGKIGKYDMEKAVKAARAGDNKGVIRHLIALEIQTKYASGWNTAKMDFLEKLLTVGERVESPNVLTQAGVTKTFAGSMIEKWLVESNVNTK
jgi:hypothetical protein